MKTIFKCTILIYMIAQCILQNQIRSIEIILILILIASNILREKYYNSIYILFLEFVCITIGARENQDFMILYGLITYDLVQMKIYIGLLGVVFTGIYYLSTENPIEYVLVMSLCGYLSYSDRHLFDKADQYKKIYDQERQHRYELEAARQKLLHSSKELVHIAEIKERNRIAREIHDHIGHSIAGILIQLQAAFKIREKHVRKSEELYQKSIQELSKTLEMLRETVYNIKPRENLGIEYIRTIVENFSFCPVDLKYQGAFNLLSPNFLEILGTNIKEALTNTARYSGATQVQISMERNEKYVRLYIKDNGRGCEKIKEGLGLSGIRERIENLGGTMSVSGEDGFMMVCFIPMENMARGEKIDESIDC